MTGMVERLNTALEGRYRIVRKLGEGGMATVYLAEDLKHRRKVALKVLKPELAAMVGGERFLAEIETTANLQHPHILPLFDSGEADGFLFYVMPFIEGESLRQKLDREKQLPVEEAVEVTGKVAAALQAAHDQGVIHRDIKPANILMSRGEPLVADFGIALALQEAGGGRLTETGLSLGTPHYMSPEQATGDRDVDARADVYALGSVLYEMVAGQPPFQASTAQAVLGRILTSVPEPLTRHRRAIPPNVEAACLQALEKLPADRFAGAQAFANALHDPSFRRPTGSPRNERRWKRIAVALAAMGVLAAGAALWGWLRPGDSMPVRRYQMVLPEGEEIGGWTLRIALSPDGSRLVYIHENEQGERELWLRHRDQLHAAPIPGTSGAEAPFFSPDGERVGFFSPRGTLRTVALDGGSSVRVATTLVGSAGAAWAEDGTLYADGRGGTGLVRVPAGGGAPEYFTALDTADGEIDHVLPAMLPGDQDVLFVIKYDDPGRSNIALADPATGSHRVLVEGLHARYAPSGYLVYGLNTFPNVENLVAQPFDPRTGTLRGRAISLAENAAAGAVGAPGFIQDLATAEDGTLMYLAGSGGTASSQVVWVERDGTSRPVDPAWTDEPAQGVALSPDGTRLALDPGGEIWVRDLESGAMTKLTFEGGLRPHWSANGAEIAFVSDRTALRQAYVRNADGTGGARLLTEDARQVHEVTYSPDGLWLVYRVGGGGVGDLYARRREEGDSIPLVETVYQENHASVSPDGRWLAYTSLESGRPEVWIRPFPNAEAGSWRVSVAGGTEPRWAPGGGELFFRSGNGDMVSVEVVDGPTFVHSRPRTLFPAGEYRSFVYNPMYSPAPDGRRFIMVRTIREPGPLQPVVIENIHEALRARDSR